MFFHLCYALQKLTFFDVFLYEPEHFSAVFNTHLNKVCLNILPGEEHRSEHLRWARGSWLYPVREELGEQCGTAAKQV